MKNTPWSRQRGGFTDTTARRIEVRMVFLGLTHQTLGERFGKAEDSAPLSGSAIRGYLSGARPFRRSESRRWQHVPGLLQPIERFAAALCVPVAALEPDGPWEPLVSVPAGGAA